MKSIAHKSRDESFKEGFYRPRLYAPVAWAGVIRNPVVKLMTAECTALTRFKGERQIL